MTAGDREVDETVGRKERGLFAETKKGADESAQASREISRAGARPVGQLMLI